MNQKHPMTMLVSETDVAQDQYTKFTLTFPGGSLRASKDVLQSLFKQDLLPSTCNPEEITVTRKAGSYTTYPFSDELFNRKEATYKLKNYSNGGNSRASSGEAIKFLINGSFWTARLVGSHQAFMDYLCANTESLEGDVTYWVSSKGSPYILSHSSANN